MSDVLVLCYHAISERWPADLSVFPDAFEEQVRSLLQRGYRATTFTDAVIGATRGRTLAITFDDAYRSVWEIARPVLSALGAPATVFVPTAFPSSGAPMAWQGIDHWLGGPFEDELRCASWEQLGALAEEGWEIGSHTHAHPSLISVDDETLADELERSRRLLTEHLGVACGSLAYPYGDYDRRVVAATRRAGYEVAATLSEAPTSALEWPRTGVYHRDDLRRFRIKSMPFVRRVRASRLWGAITRRERPPAVDA